MQRSVLVLSRTLEIRLFVVSIFISEQTSIKLSQNSSPALERLPSEMSKELEYMCTNICSISFNMCVIIILFETKYFVSTQHQPSF